MDSILPKSAHWWALEKFVIVSCRLLWSNQTHNKQKPIFSPKWTLFVQWKAMIYQEQFNLLSLHLLSP